MGLTDQAGQRVIITNCDDLPEVMNRRKGFYCIRGTDLERLQARDFELIVCWLQGAAVETKRKAPLPHQEDALNAILAVLKKHDRASVLMPCGTGKTLLTLWAAERLGQSKIIVLVPSLALLRQTLHEWLKETIWKEMPYLCVCSDPTVVSKEDEVVVQQSDTDFPVTTESAVVRRFLEADVKLPRIIFSTYQSARVVAEGMGEVEAFDLGIFDEAHKTAGREGVNFSFALKDENLPVARRLFLTATPRHYDVRKVDKEGDAKLVYSMDVPEVYGSVAYQLTFAEVVRRKIICNYKVIISVVTSEMVTDELLRRGEVMIDGDLVRARQVANQIALKNAVESYGIQKIITFHKSIASAGSFTGKGGQGISTHMPDPKRRP
jgi:predicted helicase